MEENLSELALTACEKCLFSCMNWSCKKHTIECCIKATVKACRELGTELDLINAWDVLISQNILR